MFRKIIAGINFAFCKFVNQAAGTCIAIESKRITGSPEAGSFPAPGTMRHFPPRLIQVD
jgi:hypothetical protein